jgi:hypothetical protein
VFFSLNENPHAQHYKEGKKDCQRNDGIDVYSINTIHVTFNEL